MVCLTDLSERSLTLAPEGEGAFTLALGFGLNRGKARATHAACQAAIADGWTPAAEERRHRDLLRRAPEPPPHHLGDAASERLYAHAISGLQSLFIQGDGGYTGRKHVPWTTKDFLAIAFYWDTAFSCLGAREFAPELAQEAIVCFTENATPRGSLPGTLCDTHRAGEGQAPIMTWAAWSVYRVSGDAEWLARVYPALAGVYRFWQTYHRSERGFCQYFNAGQVGDNDPRWDPVYGREMGNEPVHGVESPDLNAFIVMQLACLARMAQELGEEGDAVRWAAHSDDLAERIVAAMYFPERAIFLDVREGTHEPFSGVKNPMMFMPLWAGVPLPAEEVQRVVEEHLLNPLEFWGQRPFPSVSFDHPQYDPNGYWRGRVWPHVGYWMVQTLWRCGYEAEAEEAAGRLLDLLASGPWIHENYNSATGQGWDTRHRRGFPEYNWSLAVAIELLLERYKEPVI
jgi:glycogen debranching enzyme